jgi:hypothetical protein
MFICATGARSQVLYGSLVGNVGDQNDAAVSGAKVELTNLATGDVRTTTTDERGAYTLNDLQVGVYKITIARASFKTLIKEDVKIEANKTYRFDAQLAVGEVQETVVVTAAQEATLQTDRGDVNITKTDREINNLPLFGSSGRNYQTLISLIPGTARGTGGFFLGGGSGEDNSAAGNPQRSISYNVNGVSRLQNNTRIDGSSVIYPWLPTNTVYVPPTEAIQEVNIVTNAFDAEQGLAGGAAINLTIKTGGNDFHGAGWLYDTNSRFQSRNFFQSPTQTKIPKNILAQFGYAFSGPIILPHFGEGGPTIWNGKNKLFFFTDLERTTQRNAARQNLVSVAPPSLRPDANGNVSFAGTGTTIFDPASNPDPRLRTPFPNNVIPANRIDIAALELIRRLPLPNGPGFTNNYAPTAVGAQFNRTNMDFKVNYVSSKLMLWGRYSRSPTNIIDPPILGEIGGGALNGGQLGTAPGLINVIGIGGTYTFNPSVVLDANIGYTRQRLGAQADDIGTPFGLTLLKIPGTNGPDGLQGGYPAFQITGWNNLGNDQTGSPFLFRDNQYLAAANLSWLKGSHSFRFGADYLNPQINHFQPQGGAFQTVRGTFQFSGTATALEACNAANTGTAVCGQPGATPTVSAANSFNAWAAFLLGLPSGAGKVDQLRNPNSVWWRQYALYARDHWQINRKLTLIYGLRWERFPIPRKDHTGINRFDPATGQVVTGGLSGIPFDGGATSGSGLFLPRIGIAFRYNDKTVIRGGYGQSADPRPFQDMRNAYPIVNIWSMPAVTFGGLTGTSGFIPVTNLRQGLINTTPPPDLSQGLLPLPPNTGTNTFPKNSMRDKIHSFNIFIERQLPAKFVANVGYVGTRANGQMGFVNINASAPGTSDPGRPLFPLISDINSIQPYGNTTYDGLQALITRRWASSLIGVAYTWSKAINFADNDAGPRIQYLPEKQRNRGPASFDRAHNLQSYAVYDLPFGKGQRWARDGWESKIFGGFQVSGVMSIMTGIPFYVVQNTAPALLARGSQQVPNQVSQTINILGGIGTPALRGAASGPWFDNTVLGGPAIFGVTCTSNCAWALENGARFGNGGRNNLRGPDFFETDLSIFRTFSVTETVKFQLRAEALNATNHANFNLPDTNVNSTTFGYITSTFGPNQSRQWRFGARLSF